MIIVGASVDVFSEVVETSSFTTSFDENLFIVSFSYVVSSERRSASNLILTSSFPNIFFDYTFFKTLSASVILNFHHIEKSWLGGWCQYAYHDQLVLMRTF